MATVSDQLIVSAQFDTKRLHLRTIKAADRDLVHQGLSDPEMYRYYGFRITEPRHLQQQMDWYAYLQQERKGQHWVISRRGEQDGLGVIGLYDYTPAHQRAELGYWLLPAAQGQGYMTEAINSVLEVAFDEARLHKVVAYVEGENQASARLLPQQGFVHEGTLREEEFKDGRWVDILAFGCLHPGS